MEGVIQPSSDTDSLALQEDDADGTHSDGGKDNQEQGDDSSLQDSAAEDLEEHGVS